MAHEFESGVFTENKPAWHGLGVTMPNDALDTREALQYSGLAGWDLTKQPIYAGNPEDGFNVIAGKHAVTRATDNSVLGVVGDYYRIIQNEDAFDWVDNLLGGEGFHIKTAGSLRHGQIVWVLAKAPFTIDLPDSPIDLYVLLANSHDGSGACRAMVTPERVVCRNTLKAAIEVAVRSYSIRHTTNAEDKLTEAQAVLGLAKGAAQRMEQRANEMRKQKLTDAAFKAFLAQLVPAPDDEGRARTAALETRAAIDTIYRTAADQVEIKGTAWGAFNAVTNYWDHAVKSRQSDADGDENRMIRVVLKESGKRLLPREAAELLGAR